MKSFFTLLFLASSVMANIGDTLEQSIVKYGPIYSPYWKKHNDTSTWFQKNGFVIITDFQNGKCVYMEYARDRISFRSPIVQLTPTEISFLLKQNSNNFQWTYDTGSSTLRDQYFIEPKFLLVAHYSTKDGELYIMTADYMAQKAQETKSREAQGVQGL